MSTKQAEIRYEDAAEQRTITLWFCKQCNHGYRDEHLARWCCSADQPCECGGRKGKHSNCCDVCRRKREDEREAKRFAKATHDANYDGPVWHGDEHYSSVEDFVETWLDRREEGAELPAYVWCSVWQKVPGFCLADRMNDLDCWPDETDYDFSGLEPIQELIDEWRKEQGDVSYVPDYSRYVLLDWSGYDNSH